MKGIDLDTLYEYKLKAEKASSLYEDRRVRCTGDFLVEDDFVGFEDALTEIDSPEDDYDFSFLMR